MVKYHWDCDLEMEVPEDQWCRIHTFNQTLSTNMATKEHRFKLLNKRYLTPKRLARMYPNLLDQCWNCRQEEADYYCHLWWACPKVFAFWKSIGFTLSQVIWVNVPITPKLMLLLDMEYFQLQEYKMLFANLLSAASLLKVETTGSS